LRKIGKNSRKNYHDIQLGSDPYPMVLVCRDRHEFGFRKCESLEVLRLRCVLLPRAVKDDVQPRLVAVHRVQDDLEPIQQIFTNPGSDAIVSTNLGSAQFHCRIGLDDLEPIQQIFTSPGSDVIVSTN
jgi:hypothetical protein